MDTIKFNGQEFSLGCHERTAAVGSLRPCLEEAMPILSEAQWQPCDFSALVPEPGLQGEHGACAAFNGGDALLTARKIAGLGDVALSFWLLYAQVCGGRDGGSAIHDVISTLHTVGTCRLATCPDFTLDPDAGGDAWKTEATRYRIDQSFDCPDQASIATAIQNRFPTPLGLAVYANFTSLETIEGQLCVPKPAGRLRGLHCVLGCGLANIGGLWRVKIATKSWGDTFGDQGCCYYPLTWLSNSYADAWGIRSPIFSED
jgi:hypothetical protein